jgi:YfiH family protein
MFLRGSILDAIPGVVHGFGTFLEPIPSIFQEEWDSVRPFWKQVHGTGIAEVHQPGQICGEVDGFFTDQLGIPIGVMTADCVPILLAHVSGKAVAAIHAGWRGTKARIVDLFFDRLVKKDSAQDPYSFRDAQQWVAAIGPAIGPCCYEVSAELYQEFLSEFKHLGPEIGVSQFRKLDLPGIHEKNLRQIGLAQVDLIRQCTRCTRCTPCSTEPLFHSFRRDPQEMRQYSLIMRQKS